MNTGFVISTVFEMALGGFIIWGFCREEVLIRFEDRIRAALRRRFGRGKKRHAKLLAFSDETGHCA